MTAPPHGHVHGPIPRRASRPEYHEFLAEPFTTLVSSTDADGRPLCPEALVPAEIRQTFKTRTCGYAGSRHRHPLPMNVSALRQVTHHWRDIVAGAAFLRANHAARTGRTAPSLVDVMTIAYTGGWLPSFLTHRARAAYGDGEIPGFVSALHKAIVDVGATAQVMVLERLRRGDRSCFDAPADGDAVAAFAEERGFFIGAQGVCAGPPALVAELLSALLGGGPPPSAAVSALVGDVDALFAYSEGVLATFLGKMLMRGSSHYTLDDLAGRVGDDAPHVLARVREAEAATAALRASHRDVTLLSLIDTAKRRVLLDARGSERPRLRQGLRDLLGTLAPDAAGPGQWVFDPVDGQPDHALRRFVTGNTHGHAVSDAAATAFEEALRLEADLRNVFERLERRIRRALGDHTPPRALGPHDFAHAFGVTAREVAGALLSVTVTVERGRTVVARGDETFALAPPGHGSGP